LSLSIEQPLFKQLEALAAEGGYTNRSEFVRNLIRDRLVEDEWESNAEALGTISLLYDHHARGLAAKLTHKQHHFAGKVLATTHIHLDEHLCSEMIMVRGRAGNIRQLTDQLGREKGVLHARLAIGSIGKRLS
jgi:CopG family nickel-responsive transcriptional regulator